VTARLVTAHATVSKGRSRSEFPLEAALPHAGKQPSRGGGVGGNLGTLRGCQPASATELAAL